MRVDNLRRQAKTAAVRQAQRQALWLVQCSPRSFYSLVSELPFSWVFFLVTKTTNKKLTAKESIHQRTPEKEKPSTSPIGLSSLFIFCTIHQFFPPYTFRRFWRDRRTTSQMWVKQPDGFEFFFWPIIGSQFTWLLNVLAFQGYNGGFGRSAFTNAGFDQFDNPPATGVTLDAPSSNSEA